MRKQNDFFGLYAILTFIAFVTCALIGVYTYQIWLIWFGVGLFIAVALVLGAISFRQTLKALRQIKKQGEQERTQEEETALLNKVNQSGTFDENRAAVYECYRDYFPTKETRKQFWRLATKKSKCVFILITLLVVLLLLAFLVGLVLQSYLPEGFILMSAGFVGLFSLLFIALFHSLIQRRRYFKKDKIINSPGKVRRLQGIVVKCVLHSMHSTGSRRRRLFGTLYQMLVKPNEEGEHFWLVCARMYEKGELVYYYENIKRPKLKYIED